jgi:hypothetical protein
MDKAVVIVFPVLMVSVRHNQRHFVANSTIAQTLLINYHHQQGPQATMTSSNEYLSHHLQLLADLYKVCLAQAPFNAADASDTDREIISGLERLSEASAISDEFQQLGQAILTRIIGNYPHITANINRDLLWFFAGDCLHFMGDDEIALYQQIDELLYQQPSMDYQDAKASVFQLH